MNIITIKINMPHPWIIAQYIVDRDSSILGISYCQELGGNAISGFIPVKRDLFSIEELKKGIQYWFKEEKDFTAGKSNLLILTDQTEKENKELIKILETFNINNEKNTLNDQCFVICDQFWKTEE